MNYHDRKCAITVPSHVTPAIDLGVLPKSAGGIGTQMKNQANATERHAAHRTVSRAIGRGSDRAARRVAESLSFLPESGRNPTIDGQRSGTSQKESREACQIEQIGLVPRRSEFGTIRCHGNQLDRREAE